MKQYKYRVNGQTYDVVINEINGVSLSMLKWKVKAAKAYLQSRVFQ